MYIYDCIYIYQRDLIEREIVELESSQTPSAAASAAAVTGNGKIRYRSPSASELIESQSMTINKHHSRNQLYQKETLFDKIYKLRGVITIVTVPLLLISFVVFFTMSPSQQDQTLLEASSTFNGRKMSPKSVNSYAVIFDAGSSGSRVHVFCFNERLDLVPIGKQLELFVQKKPGLSSYADNPKAAAESLMSLLQDAESVVPKELRGSTPVRVGATAGLRALEGDTADRILQEVRDLLRQKSTLKSQSNWVTILDGSQEGSYQWVTINYLLGNLGKKYSDTVGVVDLGGGSVQMAYAISEADAAKAPRILNGEDTYVKEMFLMGVKYYLYVHSYLHYGLLAARAEILSAFEETNNPCILDGSHGSYKYGGKVYDASSSSASSLDSCRRLATKALRVNESTCTHMKCTFGGIWNGGGGDGQKNLLVASFFFDRAAEAGFIDRNKPTAKVRPVDFEEAAKRACETTLEDAKTTYPLVEEGNLPFLCMDLVYQYTLLVDGFALDPWQHITLVKQIEYQHSLVEAAWPLGSAIEAVSLPK